MFRLATRHGSPPLELEEVERVWLDHVRPRGRAPESDAGILITMHGYCALAFFVDCVKSPYL